METKFKFEKLIVWQQAMDLGEEINIASDTFPSKETYNLSSQIRRAVDSIALNIAEGSIRQSYAEYKRFLGYAIRSLAEVITCLHKSYKRKYIEHSQFKTLYNHCFDLMNMLVALKKKIV
ncbi:four helix bundle protein [Galbibacter pacificus]|uniref:Four helix bundle protein n=1 Tax=Galbibacter pacificus TaxID=2996052 RepID=A0ABT6FVQ4_9FLAO|nr:four helix bundle protein [Galbibacter pacificus]MDG3583734.1 four helix bundle protein [Galbibacter pacificus]MDG3587348.1 four helix bundle protein [Galbibacter pacificus]